MNPTTKLGLSIMLVSLWVGVMIFVESLPSETADKFALFGFPPHQVILILWLIGVVIFMLSRDR